MPRVLDKIFRRASVTTAAALVIAGMACGISGMARAADGQLQFTLVVANTEVVTNDDNHLFVLAGHGSFSSDAVEGGGAYFYTDLATKIPNTILSQGTWKATEVVRWTPAQGGATFARLHPGTLDLLIDIIPDHGPVIKGAMLRINCNAGMLGQPMLADIVNKDPDTGELLAEGFWLTIPGSAFHGVPVGPFVPFDPIFGITEIGRF